jgi:cytoskeleton-associated protein 5
MGKAFEVVRLASSSPSFTKKEALIAVTGAVDKLADLKLKGPACDMLLAVSEAVGPQCVAAWLHKRAAVHKNPKVLAEALNWTSSAMQVGGAWAYTQEQDPAHQQAACMQLAAC